MTGGARESGASNTHRRRVLRPVLALLTVGAIVVALVAAVPGLAGVMHELSHARPGWVAAAAVAEIASGFAFVLFFQLVFWRGPRRFAARLAWAEMGASSVLPVGGAGGLGVGAWILRTVGMPTRAIAVKSSVVFMLTSAVNVAALPLIGVGLATGLLSGPRDAALTVGPAVTGLALIGLFVWIPRFTPSRPITPDDKPSRLQSSFSSLATGINESERMLRRHNWRLLGAVGYLAFDVATLWLAFRAFGSWLPFGAVAMGYLIGMAANALPIPGGVGAVDASLVGMLTVYGAPFSTAAAATLVYRALALWIPTLVGALAYVLLRLDLRRPVLVKESPGSGPSPIGNGPASEAAR